jgi:hypothetical protein
MKAKLNATRLGANRAASRPRRLKERGFALIVTLSLMILLTVIAVGLLTLSTVSLRSSSQSNEVATARANARMALIMALGELQKAAGPDQRVTARADILGTNIKNPRLTGVWQSWDMKVTGSDAVSPRDYEKSARDDKFLRWLVSSTDAEGANEVEFADETFTDAVTLWGEGSLGENPSKEDIVMAQKIPTLDSRGALAWAVMDEGVKVRINTPFVEKTNSKQDQIAQLGSGQRPKTESINGLEGLKRSYFEKDKNGSKPSNALATIEKGVTKLNFELAADSLATGVSKELKKLSHDVTTISTGLLTNTATGGLKEDFNLISNSQRLPEKYLGQGVYNSLLGITGPSDPRWESLHQFSRLNADGKLNLNGEPLLYASAPKGWKAGTGSPVVNTVRGAEQPPKAQPILDAPVGPVLMPTVAKVQMLFSLLVRDIYSYPRSSPSGFSKPPTLNEAASVLHSPWGGNFATTPYDYLLHMLLTPMVTLHNPYNVAIEFQSLKIKFNNVPFAAKIYRDGIAQSSDFVPLDCMFNNTQYGNKPKEFTMDLHTNVNEKPGIQTIKMLPGQVILFTPHIDPVTSFAAEIPNGAVKTFVDHTSNGADNSRTAEMKGTPGWKGIGVGFDFDWLHPETQGGNDYETVGVTTPPLQRRRRGCIGVTENSKFHVEFIPRSIDISGNKFGIEIYAAPLGGGQVQTAMIEIDYENKEGLMQTLPAGQTFLRYPKEGMEDARNMYEHATLKINEQEKVKAFALLSVQAKTTKGKPNDESKDGNLATKPWCFAHANIGASTQKISQGRGANASHEFYLEALEGDDVLNRFEGSIKTGESFFITGNTNRTGRKYGIQYEVPLAPLQSLATLNGANPGGSSGYLPRFAQPIGNSWAHPLLNSSSFLAPGSGNSNYLDHSFLLNLALYDRFYFSGMGDQTGPYGNNKDSQAIADDFVAGGSLTDPRLTLNIPKGKTAENLTKEVKDDLFYSEIASWQSVRGAFNINSTSVAAWKAMLGSIHDSEALATVIGSTSSQFVNLKDVEEKESRISRFRIPASAPSTTSTGKDLKSAYWLGAREYSDQELEKLAEEIVEQVRLRGPFLSMAEFVNRRLGRDEKAQSGALQNAIDESELNNKFGNDADAGYEIQANDIGNNGYANATAGRGPSNQGAPGYLSQADILSVLGNAATSRSDTFTIRGYGEVRDPKSKKVIASAICEATIQRQIEYVDPKDGVDAAPESLANSTAVKITSEANKKFGRRFEILSFRWLSKDEV